MNAIAAALLIVAQIYFVKVLNVHFDIWESLGIGGFIAYFAFIKNEKKEY